MNDCEYKPFFISQWPVYYEDNHLFVVYKPAGLLIQGDRTRDLSLLELGKRWIKDNFQKPGEVFLGLVHRLDRPVAGVVLFCRTSKSARRMSEQFRTGHVEKRYVAVVEGRPRERSGYLVNHLERHGTSCRIVPVPTALSREARLAYEILDTTRTRSLVGIRLETGRHHQIRVQLAHMGLPILGDLRYGASGPMPQKQIALFAEQLTITHPVRKTPLTCRASLPEGWPWKLSASDQKRPPWNWAALQRFL